MIAFLAKYLLSKHVGSRQLRTCSQHIDSLISNSNPIAAGRIGGAKQRSYIIPRGVV
jgi:hypothetical protein